MIDFDKIREEQVQRVNNFEASCKVYAKDCPVIIELLESHEMTQYRLFKVHKGNLESMESIARSLHHAFLDDGSWHVARELNAQATDSRARMNNIMKDKGKSDKLLTPIVYNYYLQEGDSETNMNINEHHLSEMIKLDSIHYNYYDDNKDAIESGFVSSDSLGIRSFSEEHKEYFRLSRLLDEYLEKVYIETLWDKNDA